MSESSIVLLTSLEGELRAQAQACLGGPRCTLARDLADLQAASAEILLSFGTSVIVPPDLLRRFRAAYNLHAASPQYPGRDPHHFAVYDRVPRYGATLHVMTERVDAGPIVDVEWFDVPPECSPTDLLRRANEAAITLLRRWGPRLQGGEAPAAAGAPIEWTGTKRTRTDFLAMCQLPSSVSREEFERRANAFNMPGYDNLTVEMHGRTFRIENKNAVTADRTGKSPEADRFTHARYRALLRCGLAAGYCFVDFADLKAQHAATGKFCALRHDCDNDLVAAARIAEIEAEEGVRSTYFVMLRSALYNVLAPTNRALVSRILKCGHWLGLHFDHSVVADKANESIAALVDEERRILSAEFGHSVAVVSFHQPGPAILDNRIKLNCLNTYDRDDMAGVHYTSDSNLVFRGGEPERLFADGTHAKVQILLHPEWWTENPMPLDEKWNCMLLDNIGLMQENLLEREDTFTARRDVVVQASNRI